MERRMTEEEFVRIYRFLKNRYGIDMLRKKEIVQGRLENYVQAKGFLNYQEYMNAVELDCTGALEREMVNILTTNHTFFMREFEHFEYLRQVVLPQLRNREETKKDLCIWCGAASTGQEPYMLAMLLKDFFGLEHEKWDTKVLASGTETFSEDKSTLVKYIGLQDKERYARPVDDFCGFKEIDGNNVPRFALVKEIKIDLQKSLNEVLEQNNLEL